MDAILTAPPPAEPLPVLRLVGLLAGLGARAGELTEELVPATGVVRRTCIDAGAGAVFAVRAPGPRLLDVQTRRASAADPGGPERWDGLRAGREGVRARWTRTVRAGRSGSPVVAHDRLSAVLSAYGRVWSVEHDATGRCTAVSWQIHRHVPVRDVLREAGVPGCWRPAAEAFDRLHGFAVSGTAGPWSVTRLTDADPPDRRPVIRIGTTRWAWSADDEGKRHRFAAWIDAAGGDGPYAAALHGLLVDARTAGRALPVGRAAEVDLVDDAIVAVAGYLAAPPLPAHPFSATDGSPR